MNERLAKDQFASHGDELTGQLKSGARAHRNAFQAREVQAMLMRLEDCGSPRSSVAHEATVV